MLFKGIIAADCSGRLGDMVFSRNRGGPYVRALGNPNPNPPTEIQALYREKYNDVISAWQGLSETAREQWRSMSRSQLRTSRIGVRRPAGGWPEFVKANLIRSVASAHIGAPFSTVDTPPRRPVAPLPDPLPTITNGDGTFITITFPSGPYWLGEEHSGILISISPTLTPTRQFFKGPWAMRGYIAGDSTSVNLDTLATFAAPNRVRVKFQVLLSTGAVSRAWTSDITGP